MNGWNTIKLGQEQLSIQWSAYIGLQWVKEWLDVLFQCQAALIKSEKQYWLTN